MYCIGTKSLMCCSIVVTTVVCIEKGFREHLKIPALSLRSLRLSGRLFQTDSRETANECAPVGWQSGEFINIKWMFTHFYYFNNGPYKTCIGTHRHTDTSALFSMQIVYWILTCKVLDPMPAISPYSAIFPPSSAAIWCRCSVADHQAPLCAPICILYRPFEWSQRLKCKLLAQDSN